MAMRLQMPADAVYNAVMPRENKTEHMLLRVRPSFKKEVSRVADAVGKNVTETIEDAFAVYKQTKKVRDALTAAKPTEPAPKEEG